MHPLGVPVFTARCFLQMSISVLGREEKNLRSGGLGQVCIWLIAAIWWKEKDYCFLLGCVGDTPSPSKNTTHTPSAHSINGGYKSAFEVLLDLTSLC